MGWVFFSVFFFPWPQTIHKIVREGKKLSPLPPPPVHWCWVKFFQLCIWNDFLKFFLATEICPPIGISIWFNVNCRLLGGFILDVIKRWIWTSNDYRPSHNNAIWTIYRSLLPLWIGTDIKVKNKITKPDTVRTRLFKILKPKLTKYFIVMKQAIAWFWDRQWHCSFFFEDVTRSRWSLQAKGLKVLPDLWAENNDQKGRDIRRPYYSHLVLF